MVDKEFRMDIKIDYLKIIHDIVWFGWWFSPTDQKWYRYVYEFHWTIKSKKICRLEFNWKFISG